VLPDASCLEAADHAHMTYAMMISADGGPATPGRVYLELESVSFSDGRRIRYPDLPDIYLERRPNEPPALVLEPHYGERLRLVSLEGLGALHELAERLYDARWKAAA
jgi:hypothetical protein